MKAFYSHVHGRAFPDMHTHTHTQTTANVLQAICVSIYSGWRGERERKGSVGGGDSMFIVSLQGRSFCPGERLDSRHGRS